MSGPRVTDHALVRFLERAAALDLETLRARLSASLASAHGAADAIGGGRYLILADGLIYVMQDDVLVTVLPEPPRPRDVGCVGQVQEGARPGRRKCADQGGRGAAGRTLPQPRRAPPGQ